MSVAENVLFIVNTEPWRNGQGRPKNSIDPIWAGDSLELCGSDAKTIEWEAEGSWWWCTKCGHCSNAHRLEHYIVESPMKYRSLSMQQFLKRRGTQGFPDAEAQQQAQHITGVALRVAASRRPDEFAALVDSLLELAAS